MLFDVGTEVLESEKERNLYTKFFAGYYFNEFIEGYENRVSSLNGYLSKCLSTNINLINPFVSFDNHAYILDIDSDRGEFADILLHDKTQKTMIAIEAKYLTNWSVEKDLDGNINRIDTIRKRYPEYTLHFCLLISRTKWKATEKMKNHGDSSYTRYVESYQDRVGLLFWEDLAELCKSEKVRDYMSYRLSLVNVPREKRFANIQN